ncbi:hypothetical protein [Longimicrobium terrae]|uniref:Uncharacterized protein n=1 Tax=Longimicrobium terrae TaxID=1639882 RepID=A0A841H0E7_9BACT|nr:hypothetical protein [Longimicrobium terrae]MBB4636973.1 hypothetical protein [Longimicrobium terrae]MBB6071419.1 hypothetical protein [Longimicrobium terrae]NNC31360.1 hypothetical protein [Longimicrobium terrae]
MDLDQFLVSRDVDLPTLVDRVNAKLGLLPADVLIAVGSLVEGLGTTKSDLDLLLVTARPGEQSGSEVAVVAGRCLVDVRVLPVWEITDLVGKVEDWYRSPWDVTHAVRFTIKDRLLLHRLLRGRRLTEGSGGGTGDIPWPRQEVLARLKLQVARQHARTVQVDMAGHRDMSDWCSLVYAAQDLLGASVDALTAGYGLTNPYSKWRSRMLERVPDSWEHDLGSRPDGRSAAEAVWRLHHTPERPDREAALEHAFRISAFSRMVFSWAERRLVLNSAAAEGADRSWPAERPQPGAERLPFLDFDVDFQLAGEQVLLGRLNEFAPPARLSRAEFGMALLFDGITTVREAGAVFQGRVPEGEEHRPAQTLVAKLAGARLLAP